MRFHPAFSRLGLAALGASALFATGCDDGFLGTWTVKAEQVVAAGFATVTFAKDDTWRETGRTDGQLQNGTYSQPDTVDISADYGPPPAGMEGPYVELVTGPAGDGTWVYGWDRAGASLTLNRYAQRTGMGLRWAAPLTISLTAE